MTNYNMWLNNNTSDANASKLSEFCRSRVHRAPKMPTGRIFMVRTAHPTVT